MGNPVHISVLPASEYIACWRQTRGTETSQYPQEEKENSIPIVAASEVGRAQTEKLASRGCRTGHWSYQSST